MLQPAVPHHGNMLCEIDGFLRVMSDQHAGNCLARLQRQKTCMDASPRERIEPGERFVEKQEFRTQHHGAAQTGPLLLSSG